MDKPHAARPRRRPGTRTDQHEPTGRGARRRATGSTPVRALYVYNCNPAAVSPNQRGVIAGLMRDDLFTVVHELFATDTVDYADIVLPGDDAA